MEDTITLDRVRGMFMGAFLGDALGAPHEFKCNNSVIYTGKIEHRPFRTSQFQGKKELEVGQITDDSELTITLLRQLIKDQGYVKNNVIMEYLGWSNTENTHFQGKNTRALFKGIKTLKGYQNRIAKILLSEEHEISQSNGSLMRCSPLALLNDDICIVEDVNITNPCKVNRDCGMVYIKCLRMALKGERYSNIFEYAKEIAETDEVKFVLQQVENREVRDISDQKGWCLHALWCTFIVLTSFKDYDKAMNWVINIYASDTDTNACIAGAMLGATLGFDKLNSEELTKSNIEILLNSDVNSGPTPRPAKYQPHDFFELTEQAYHLATLKK
jgi:ADP-ribosylglycohydrolase